MNADQRKLLELLEADRKALLRAVPSYVSVPEDRMDIVQDALRNLAEMDLPQRLRTLDAIREYARSTVRNLARDWFRKPRHRLKHVPATDVLVDEVLLNPQDNPTPEQINSGRQQDGLINRALNTLDDTTRQVLFLRLRKGYTHEEIAKKLGLKPSSVRSMASAGLKQLNQVYVKLSGNADSRRD